MKALILNAEENTAEIRDVPIPVPGPLEILVKVSAVALNPVDPLYVSHPLGSTGRTVGSDFAGTIASLGEAVPPSSSLVVGQRVAGLVQGACSVNDRPGAFAEYVVSPWDLVWKVPDAIGIEEAATVSLCGLTAAQAVFVRLGLQAPFAAVLDDEKNSGDDLDETNFLIYGASTSVGLFAAQLVRRSAEANGQRVKLIGLASKDRWQILKSEPYGYDDLVDYRDSNWATEVRKLTGGVHYAFDCISEGNTVEFVNSTLAENGEMAIVRSRAGGAWKADSLAVEPGYGAVWEGLGVEVQYQGFTIPKSERARAFAVDFFRWLSEDGTLAPNTVRLMPGGLENVVKDGFMLLGTGGMKDRKQDRIESWMKPVAAEKLVYRIYKEESTY